MVLLWKTYGDPAKSAVTRKPRIIKQKPKAAAVLHDANTDSLVSMVTQDSFALTNELSVIN